MVVATPARFLSPTHHDGTAAAPDALSCFSLSAHDAAILRPAVAFGERALGRYVFAPEEHVRLSVADGRGAPAERAGPATKKAQQPLFGSWSDDDKREPEDLQHARHTGSAVCICRPSLER